MQRTESWDVVVIGAGMAGLSTALWARRLGLTALVLEGLEQPGGQLRAISQPISDYPGLAATPGREFCRRLAEQTLTIGACLRSGEPVLRVRAAAKTCETAHAQIAGKAVVIATGLVPRRLSIPGEDELMDRGLLRRPSAELPWFAGKRVAVIGGGDRAAENALLLATVADRVCLIHRGRQLRARAPFQAQVGAASKIDLYCEAAVHAIGYDGAGALLSVAQGESTFTLPIDAVCIYIGNRAASDLVRGQVALAEDGTIITSREGQSSAPGLYAVGDVATAPPYQSLSTAAGQAMAAAKHIALSCS